MRREKEQPLATGHNGVLRENPQGFLSGSPALFRIVDVIRVARSKEWDDAPVAQLDRVGGFEPQGWVFDSPRARHGFSLTGIEYYDKIIFLKPGR